MAEVSCANRGGEAMNEFLQRLKQRKLVQWARGLRRGGVRPAPGNRHCRAAIRLAGRRFDALLIIALGVGFFVTLVLAWYHGERGAQRVTGTELLILALLLARWRRIPLAVCQCWRASRCTSLPPTATSDSRRPLDPGKIDRGPALREPERRKAKRLLRRWHPGRNPDAVVEDRRAESHLAHFDPEIQKCAG